MYHKTTTLLNPFTNELCDIDNGMINIIKEYWRNGINTGYCCEGSYPGEISIFPTGFESYILFPINHSVYKALVCRWKKGDMTSEYWEAIDHNNNYHE